MPTLYEQWAMQKGLMQPPSAATSQAQKPKKDFWTDQISTGGGIGGALAGAAGGAALGSIVPGVGTVIGGLLGGVLGGAAGSGAGEFTENVITNEDDKLKNVGKEALLGGVFSAPPIRLARGVVGAVKGAATGAAKEGFEQGFAKQGMSLPGKVQKFAQGTADKLYTQAFTVPRRAAGNLKPEQTARELIKYGISGSLDTIDTASRNVLNQLGRVVDKAATSVGGQIQVGDVTNVVTNALKGVKITGPDRTAIMERITNIGTNGKLPGYASPSEVLETIRDLEQRGFARINAGSSGLVKNPDTVDIGNAYVQVAKELEDKLYDAVGKSGSLKALQTPQAQQALNGVAKGLGDKFMAAKDMGEVRSLMAPFVRAKNLVAMTLDEAQSAGTQGLGNLAGRGAGAGIGALAGGLPGAAAGFLAAPVLRGAEEAVRAPIATTLARGLNKASSPGAGTQAANAANPVTQATGSVAGLTTRQAIGQNVVSPMMSPPESPTTLEGALAGYGQPIGDMGELVGATQSVDQSPYPLENLRYDIQRDPANAEKYMAYYQQIQEVFGSQAQQPKLTATQQNMAVRAQNALNDIEVLQQAIESGDIQKTLVPGSSTAVGGNLLGTTDIEAALFNIGDVVLRARTGAAAPETEIRKFVAGFLPRGGESKQAQLNKLERAYRELTGMLNPPAALGTNTANTLEDVL